MICNGDKIVEELFNSKARVLKLFLHRPQLNLSVEDICRKSSLKKRAGREAVLVLEKLGILKRSNNHGQSKGKNKNKKKKRN